MGLFASTSRLAGMIRAVSAYVSLEGASMVRVERRMGPIFGGMLLSGKKIAKDIYKRL